MRYQPVFPDETVALIKSILYQDRRERKAAGYRRGSNGVTQRLAEHFGMSKRLVEAIRDGERRKKVNSNLNKQRSLTVSRERLERIRAYNDDLRRRRAAKA